MPHLTFLDIDLQDGFWLLYLLWLWTILQFLRNFHLIYSCFNWKKITLQWCVDFCHTTTQIINNYTYVTYLPCTHPIPLSHHRVPGWAPCVIQQLLTSYLFHTWWYIYVDATFSIHPTLSFPCWINFGSFNSGSILALHFSWVDGMSFSLQLYLYISFLLIILYVSL